MIGNKPVYQPSTLIASMTEASNPRRKNSAKLIWDSKPKKATSPRDIECQTAEIVIPNLKGDQGALDLPLFAAKHES